MIQTLKLIATRFTFLLCTIFILCFNNGSFIFLHILIKYTDPLLQKLVLWTGQHLLHLSDPVNPQFNGSGDTTYHYILLFVVFVLALTGTLIWSVIDLKRKSHDQLYYWLTVSLRFYVGFMLVHYGLAKLNNGQFPGPSATGMSTTYGDSSPMGLAWRFLGFSEGYKTFMFFAEMMGILLFFRKTATIGALLCLMTCVNIMAINYFYDVPVKLLSTSLVVMCLIILSSNFSRLFQFFFKGKTTGLDLMDPPVFKAKWVRITKEAVKYIAIALCAGIPAFNTLTASLNQQKEAKESLYGIYRISSLKWTKGAPAADSLYVSSRWLAMGIDRYDRAFIKYGDNETIYCKAQIEMSAKILKLSFNEEPDVRYTLSFRRLHRDTLELKGELVGKPVIISLARKEFELTKRDFRWINEVPYNR
ncbi:hypothetical protein [Pedobacter ginsengisoli]|uniref:hypothetical protein n=1 Tax=Pedobacter ginsengisoli TaxID=363852 RepID=UPI00254F81C3|nr:hypothetical protein [Pedobacter ginsengisoli]